MKGFGCQDKIRIGDREFQIHTGCDTNKNKAITEVFEKGNFIFDIVRPYQVRQINNNPFDDSYLKKSVSELHQQIIDEVLILFQITQKIKPLNLHIAHFRLGKVFYAKNFFKEAIENFKRTIELKNDNIQAYKLLGQSYLKTGDLKNAQTVFENALKLENHDPVLLNGLGVLYMQSGNFNAAKDIIQSAMSLYPDFHELNFNFGVLLFLSTIAENPYDENIILPARIIRSLKDIRKIDKYSDEEWQKEFDNILTTIKSGDKNEIKETIHALQMKMITEETLYINMDLFFLKFMYGGKEMSRREIDIFEGKIIYEAENYDKTPDYWNDLATLHLIQCRDNFLKAIDEFEKSMEFNENFKDAKDSLEMVKRGKKGFLILLRAILK